MSIYQPAEDSYLLQDSLIKFLKNKQKSIKILDMGSGSGIQAQTCKKLSFNNITTADINPKAIEHLEKQELNPIISDLFSNIKQKYGLIIFNPPYLPLDKREPKDSQLATTGGKQGYELIINFLKQSKKHLKNKATILLLFSSLSNPEKIIQKAKFLEYKIKQINSQKLPFFEEIFVYQLDL